MDMRTSIGIIYEGGPKKERLALSFSEALTRAERDIKQNWFLRHFSKGKGDYLQIQEKLFKGMRLEQIYKKARPPFLFHR
jgi:hypothetical protein